ncbi:AraC family transcriptional regulator, partial [Micromonospora sp. NPDC047753]
MALVAIAATGGMLHFELALACEVFAHDPSGLADPWYDVAICGPGPVRVGRFLLTPDDGLERLARADTVIIPSVEDVDGDIPPDLLDAVRAAHLAGARMVSLCTGAFVLAA